MTKAYESLQDAVAKANAALVCTNLRADDAGDMRPDGTVEPSIVAPTTYAPNENARHGEGQGPRVNVLRLKDRIEVRTVLNSVGAQAHRLKVSLRAALEDQPTFPFPRVSVAGAVAASAAQGSKPWQLDILDLPHGATDAYLRLTEEWSTFDPFAMELGQLDLRENVRRIYERCPHMLLVGGWDSFHRSAAKIPRSMTSTIDGVSTLPTSFADGADKTIDELVRLHVKSQRTDPLVKGQQIQLPQALLDKLGPQKKGDKKTISRVGIGDVPAKGFTDRIVIDYAIAKTTISFAGLRQMKFGSGSPSVNLAGRTATAALGILMHELAHQRGYYLRSGCSLVPTKVSRLLVTSDGDLKSAPWFDETRNILDQAQELYLAAVEGARAQGLIFAENRQLTATAELNTIVESSTNSSGEDEEAA